MNSVTWLEKRMNRQYPHYYLESVWTELEYLHLSELQPLHETLQYIQATPQSWHESHHWTETELDLRNKCSLINIAIERIIKTKGGTLC